jgi:hypothetical protein
MYSRRPVSAWYKDVLTVCFALRYPLETQHLPNQSIAYFAEGGFPAIKARVPVIP